MTKGPHSGTHSKRRFALSRVHTLIEPGPVVLLSTRAGGRDNVMTLSWHTMLDFEPPLIGCVVSDRNYSFGLLRDSGECVINIPEAALAPKVVACGNCSGRRVDKFARLGLTAKSAALVDAALIDECFAHLECRVIDSDMVPRYDFFVLEVVRAWRDPAATEPRTLHHRGRGHFMLGDGVIDLPSDKK